MSEALFQEHELRSPPSDEPIVAVRHSVYFGAGGSATHESPRERDARLRREGAKKFLEDTAQAIYARLELLRGRDFHEVIACPWSRLIECTAACQCEGSRVITVGQLFAHYHELLRWLGAPDAAGDGRRRRRRRV